VTVGRGPGHPAPGGATARWRIGRRHGAVAIASVDIVLFAISVVASGFAASFWIVPVGASLVSVSVVGAVLVWRVPMNRIGALLLGAGTMVTVGVAIQAYTILGAAARPEPWVGVAIVGLTNEVFLFAATIIILIGIPLVFPDGSLISRRWRWIVWLAIGAVLESLISALFRPGLVGFTTLENPLGAQGMVPVLDFLDGLLAALSVVGFGGAAAAVVLRFKRGGRVERQQLKWFMAVAAIAAITFPISAIVPAEVGISDEIVLLGSLTLSALPVAIGIAILRYRLYEIDRIISRTLSYALVSGTLLGVFAAGVLVLQVLLAGFTTRSAIPVAASTLLVVALFQPLRRRAQAVVDRRFDRARVDAERTVSAFADRLRDEVELSTLRSELSGAARGSLGPTRVGVWIRSRNESRTGDG